MIRPVKLEDAAALCDIYNHYIERTIVTFEEQRLDVEEFANRIKVIAEDYPWLVYEQDGKVSGYAYANKWKLRCAYRSSVETTVYLAADCHRRGIGAKLYGQLIEDLRKSNVHCSIAGTSLPNDASVALHEKLGFEKVGEFKEIGRKFEKWIDVGYWEVLLKN